MATTTPTIPRRRVRVSLEKFRNLSLYSAGIYRIVVRFPSGSETQAAFLSRTVKRFPPRHSVRGIRVKPVETSLEFMEIDPGRNAAVTYAFHVGYQDEEIELNESFLFELATREAMVFLNVDLSLIATVDERDNLKPLTAAEMSSKTISTRVHIPLFTPLSNEFGLCLLDRVETGSAGIEMTIGVRNFSDDERVDEVKLTKAEELETMRRSRAKWLEKARDVVTELLMRVNHPLSLAELSRRGLVNDEASEGGGVSNVKIAHALRRAPRFTDVNFATCYPISSDFETMFVDRAARPVIIEHRFLSNFNSSNNRNRSSRKYDNDDEEEDDRDDCDDDRGEGGVHLILFFHGFLGNPGDWRHFQSILTMIAEMEEEEEEQEEEEDEDDDYYATMDASLALSERRERMTAATTRGNKTKKQKSKLRLRMLSLGKGITGEATHMDIARQAEICYGELEMFFEMNEVGTSPTLPDAKRIKKVSLVGYSMGAIVARCFLRVLSREEGTSSSRTWTPRGLLEILHTFLSLNGPHLSNRQSSSALVTLGTFVFMKWKGIKSLAQLSSSSSPVVNSKLSSSSVSAKSDEKTATSEESVDDDGTFLLRLSREPHLGMFRKLVFVGSSDDTYVPFYSSVLELSNKSAGSANVEDPIMMEMLGNLNRTLAGDVVAIGSLKSEVVEEEEQYDRRQPKSERETTFYKCKSISKIDLLYDFTHSASSSTALKRFETYIGRTAHIHILDSKPLLMALLLVYGRSSWFP